MARGDSLEVINMPFTDQPENVVEPGVPWWQDRQLIAMVESAVKYLLLAIAAWIVWRRLVKPLLDQVPRAPVRLADAKAEAGAVAEDSDEGNEDLRAAIEAGRGKRRQQDALLTTTREAAKNDPKLVAAIIKSWMHSNA